MPQIKISQLDTVTQADSDDLLYLSTLDGGVYSSKHISVSDLFSYTTLGCNDKIVDGTYNVSGEHSESILADVRNNPVTINLPTSNIPEDYYIEIGTIGDASLNNVIIDAGPHIINDVSTLILSHEKAAIKLVWACSLWVTTLDGGGSVDGGGSGGNATIINSTYNITNPNGENILADVTAGTVSINLNSNPASGAVVDIGTVGDASLYNVIINGNGNNINDTFTSFIIDAEYGAIRLVFNGSAWVTTLDGGGVGAEGPDLGGVLIGNIINSDYAITNALGEHIIADVSSNPVIITLIETPTLGAVVEVGTAGDASINNAIIEGNGNTINGDIEFYIDIEHGAIKLVFDGTQWVTTLDGVTGADGGLGGVLIGNIINSDYTVTSDLGEHLIADVSSNPVTITLLANPTLGAVMEIGTAGDASINNAIIDGNGNTINGDNTFIVDALYGAIKLVFDGSEWVTTLDGGGQGQGNTSTVLNGTVDPTTEGVDGDFYINTTSNEIFGPKTGGAWGTGTSLVGPAGADGVDGTNGADGVDGTNGVDGVSNVLASIKFGEFTANVITIEDSFNITSVTQNGDIYELNLTSALPDLNVHVAIQNTDTTNGADRTSLVREDLMTTSMIPVVLQNASTSSSIGLPQTVDHYMTVMVFEI